MDIWARMTGYNMCCTPQSVFIQPLHYGIPVVHNPHKFVHQLFLSLSIPRGLQMIYKTETSFNSQIRSLHKTKVDLFNLTKSVVFTTVYTKLHYNPVIRSPKKVWMSSHYTNKTLNQVTFFFFKCHTNLVSPSVSWVRPQHWAALPLDPVSWH